MILIVDMNYRKGSLGFYEFVLPIVSVAKQAGKCVVKHYSEIDQSDLGNCSHIILSGTALKNHTTLNSIEEFGWIKNQVKPLLGICAGMQTIGFVFGCHLKKCLEIGMTRITTVKTNSLLSPALKAYELHNYALQVTREFDVLAESKKCVQAIKHNKKEIYGVLFHPEVRNKEIIGRFLLLPS